MDQIKHIGFANSVALRSFMNMLNHNIKTLNNNIRKPYSRGIEHAFHVFLTKLQQNHKLFLRRWPTLIHLREHLDDYLGNAQKLTTIPGGFNTSFNSSVLKYIQNVIENPETNPQTQFEHEIRELCMINGITVAPLTHAETRSCEVNSMGVEDESSTVNTSITDEERANIGQDAQWKGYFDRPRR